VTTLDGSALASSDYTALTTTVTFSPGVTSQTVVITIAADKVVEPTEAFTVMLSSPTNATIFDGTGTVTILDNDVALMASGTTTVMDGTRLSATDIAPALASARQFWAGSALDTSGLEGVTVVIADLPGLMLGQTDGQIVRLDADGAGWGWSLDGRSPGIDLREVLEHELGHVLRLSHDDADAFGVMAAVLEAAQPAKTLAVASEPAAFPTAVPNVVAMTVHAAASPAVSAGKPAQIHVAQRAKVVPAVGRLSILRVISRPVRGAGQESVFWSRVRSR
jgi:Calx-beta domain